MSRYFCPECKKVHRHDCDLCVDPDEDAPLNEMKYRPCKSCAGEAGPGKRSATDDGSATSKKQRGAGKTDQTLPADGRREDAVDTS